MNSLHIEVSGTGPDLVLLHGWGLNVRVWEGLVQKLSGRFRTIAVDLPGHGRSPWMPGRRTPAEQAWLVHSALSAVSNRYSLLGWSLGGQIALDLAAAMPAQIDRLVLVSATPRFVSAGDWPHGMQPEVIARMAARLTENYQQTVADFLELQVRGSSEAANVVEQMRNALFAHGHAKPDALMAGLNTLATNDLRATLAHVQAPTLVIAGQHDRITPPSASHALAAALPDARYVEIRRAAHAPFLSHQVEFALLVERFLRDARPEADGAAADGPAAPAYTTDAAHPTTARHTPGAPDSLTAARHTPGGPDPTPVSTAPVANMRYRAVGKAIRAANEGKARRAQQAKSSKRKYARAGLRPRRRTPSR
jgi:pimeloyl-[acyl-carrier protein] methyl ester esterase